MCGVRNCLVLMGWCDTFSGLKLLANFEFVYLVLATALFVALHVYDLVDTAAAGADAALLNAQLNVTFWSCAPFFLHRGLLIVFLPLRN